MTPSGSQADVKAAAHYCRGCGEALPAGRRTLFHLECLKADKRRRTAERRRREAERRQAWLSRQKCPGCGANLEKLANVDPRRPDVGACEASPSVQPSANTWGKGEGL